MLTNKNHNLLGWTLSLPGIIFLGGFFIFPMFYAFVISFFNWNLLGDKTFIGLSNYKFLLLEDSVFKTTLWNTLYFSLFYVFGSLILSLGTALIVHKPLRGVRVIRTILLTPLVIPMAITGIIWTLLYSPHGFINAFLNTFGIQGQQWLFDSDLAMPAIILVSIWQSFGLYAIIYVTGLQQIPQELYEGMEIDGAGTWQKFIHLTLPLLRPTTFFVVVLLLINSFKIFDQIWVMTKGGPGNATMTLVVYMYQKIFTSYGLATAASGILFIIVFGLVYGQYYFMGREDKR
ncbi:carbohydrate ABC transporter permease [Metabacillus arenae]|uniref:Sugar ABC transporter permease n=1 Tax=Metabacillus arenae TaxID=2771434 RepID=A0A926S2I3_9BACI|nr:sugar ABC transporter permease [Metabacillus arenae]MBD1382039.1 sugar ABC transporter permease [Metabacillus arenae]